MKIYICRWSGGIAPLILNLRTRWRWVVKLTPWLLYSQERAQYQTEQKAEWAPSGNQEVLEEKISCPCQDLKPRPSSR